MREIVVSVYIGLAVTCIVFFDTIASNSAVTHDMSWQLSLLETKRIKVLPLKTFIKKKKRGTIKNGILLN